MMDVKTFPDKCFFSISNSQKSQCDKSGLYSGWGNSTIPMALNFSPTTLALWGRALSCNNRIPLAPRLGRFE